MCLLSFSATSGLTQYLKRMIKDIDSPELKCDIRPRADGGAESSLVVKFTFVTAYPNMPCCFSEGNRTQGGIMGVGIYSYLAIIWFWCSPWKCCVRGWFILCHDRASWVCCIWVFELSWTWEKSYLDISSMSWRRSPIWILVLCHDQSSWIRCT